MSAKYFYWDDETQKFGPKKDSASLPPQPTYFNYIYWDSHLKKFGLEKHAGYFRAAQISDLKDFKEKLGYKNALIKEVFPTSDFKTHCTLFIVYSSSACLGEPAERWEWLSKDQALNLMGKPLFSEYLTHIFMAHLDLLLEDV
jgi:hypothetical protein